jgi:hypothetical protein
MNGAVAPGLEGKMCRAVFFLPVLACALSGCCKVTPVNSKPNEATVERIERKLAGKPCILSLDRWTRSYVYPISDGKIYDRVIAIDLEQPGISGRGPGRFILDKPSTRIDDRQFRIASATYDIASDTLLIDYCGWNVNPSSIRVQ